MPGIDDRVFRCVPPYGATVHDIAGTVGRPAWLVQRALRRLKARRRVIPIARRAPGMDVVTYWHPNR